MKLINRLVRKVVTDIPFMANQLLLSPILKEAEFHIDGISFPLMFPFFDSAAITFVRSNLNYYETAMSRKFIQCLQKDNIFIDVGAGYGYYSMLAAKILKSPGNIHAFEPTNWVATIFQINNRRCCNGQIVFNKLYVGNKIDNNSITLDRYCFEKNLSPQVIKVDIEGAEYMAIDGMERILEEDSPALLIELHERILRERYHLDAHDIIDKIKSKGYRILYNGHHYHMNLYGKISYKWTESPPNNVNYALFCYPES